MTRLILKYESKCPQIMFRKTEYNPTVWLEAFGSHFGYFWDYFRVILGPRARYWGPVGSIIAFQRITLVKGRTCFLHFCQVEVRIEFVGEIWRKKTLIGYMYKLKASCWLNVLCCYSLFWNWVTAVHFIGLNNNYEMQDTQPTENMHLRFQYYEKMTF